MSAPPAPSSAPPTLQSTPGWTWLIILVAFLITGLLVLMKGCKEKEETKKTEATATTTPVRQVVQLPDCPTPCRIYIRQVQDLYTDGEPVYVLPPKWAEEKKILYKGHGHLILEGGNIHEGWWRFWSATDPKKVVTIRAFERR